MVRRDYGRGGILCQQSVAAHPINYRLNISRVVHVVLPVAETGAPGLRSSPPISAIPSMCCKAILADASGISGSTHRIAMRALSVCSSRRRVSAGCTMAIVSVMAAVSKMRQVALIDSSVTATTGGTCQAPAEDRSGGLLQPRCAPRGRRPAPRRRAGWAPRLRAPANGARTCRAAARARAVR